MVCSQAKAILPDRAASRGYPLCRRKADAEATACFCPLKLGFQLIAGLLLCSVVGKVLLLVRVSLQVEDFGPL